MPVTTSLGHLHPRRFGPAQARHLLLRAGFGGTYKQVRELEFFGLDRAVDRLVDYQQIPAPGLDYPDVDPDVLKPLNKQQRRIIRQARKTKDKAVIDEYRKLRRHDRQADRKMFDNLQTWWLDIMVKTPHPAQEKLTVLWHSHFASSYRKVRDAYLMFQQNQFFRLNANGSFADLAHGIIRDPAMIKYLDNQRNNKRHANENLGREFLELFTVGIQNYNENDVKGASRSLTGYSEHDNSFKFRPRAHDDGIKQVFGQRGNFDGDQFVDVVLANRACSQFIAWKIYRHFVADVNEHRSRRPPWANSVIDEIANIIWNNNYQLKPVLKTILTSRHFYDPAIVGKKIKSPVESVVGTMRTLGTPQRNSRQFIKDMGQMGMALFEPPSVAGWDTGEAWINTSTLFNRENMAVYAVTGKRARDRKWRRRKTDFNPHSLLDGLEVPDVNSATHHIIDMLLGHHMTSQRRAPILQFMHQRVDKTVTSDDLIALLLLITSAPEYQLC